MKPKEFITKHGLENGWNPKKQNDFLADLTSELIAFLEYNKAANNIKGFDNAVRAIRQKWDSISNKMNGFLPEGMWRYFYATTIAKMREDMCPQQMAYRREQQEFRRKMREEREKEEQWFEEELRRAARERYEQLAFQYLILSACPVTEFMLLGLPVSATEDEVKNRYRELALKAHPDKGGSQEQFLKLTDAKNKCMKWASMGKE